MIKKFDNNILEFTTDKKEFSIIWLADAHLDSDKSKTKWMHKILKENKDSYIIFGGDNHDLMQGKSDRRNAKSSLKDEFKANDYWNRIIEASRRGFIEPYKDRIIAFTSGNHESSVTRILEFDFLDWLVEKDEINRMYTAGYIIVKYSHKNSSSTIPIYFQHHPPSGGKRSKGMLSVDLLLAEHPDAKIIISEHIHETFITPQTIERLDLHNKKLRYDTVWYIQAPTLKAEHLGKKVGFFHEKIKKSSTTIGAIKIDFKLKKINKVNKLIAEPKHLLYY